MTARESTYNQVMNIEGEALKKMAGATKGGGISAVTGWLAARGKDKDRGGSRKSAADWENEETAKKLDFKREQSRGRSALGTARKIKAEGLPLKETFSQTPNAGSSRASYYPVGSGGQGTSGNKRGPQFSEKKTTGRVSGKPPAKTTARKPAATRTPKATGSGELLV